MGWNYGNSTNSSDARGTARYFKTGSVVRTRSRKRKRGPSKTNSIKRISSNQKSKNSTSYTATKTKKKKSSTIKSPATGMSFSKTVIKYKKRRLIKNTEKLSEVAVYEKVDPFTISTPKGQQGSLGTNLLYSTHAAGTGTTPIVDLFNQAMEYSQVSGNPAGPFIQAFQRDFKYVLDSVNCMTTITNVSASNADIEIWDLVSKVTCQTYQDPLTVWDSGTAAISGPYTLPARSVPYTVPTTSKTFNITWKVVKRSKVEISAGRSHQHILQFNPNVIVDSDYWNNYAQVKGLTVMTFITCRGQIADTVASYSSGTVTIAPVKLDCITRVRYNTRSLFSAPRTYQLINNVTAPAGDVYEFEEGAGQVLDMITGALSAVPAG